jgi:hypothetical protein
MNQPTLVAAAAREVQGAARTAGALARALENRHNAAIAFIGGHMLRKLIGAAAIVVLSAGLARAQVTSSLPGSGPYDGTSDFNFNIMPDYDQTRPLAEIERDREIERRYRETIRARIPDRKPASNDPWKSVRQAPAVAYDRYRPE